MALDIADDRRVGASADRKGFERSPMQLSIGKFKSKPTTTQLLILKDPSYVAWVFDHPKVEGKLAEIRAALARHIAVFDEKPLKTRCGRCGGAATCGCVYVSATVFTWWCEECCSSNPATSGPQPIVVRSYQDAIEHVRYNCESNRQKFKSVVKALARSKGAPFRVSETAAREFLE